MLISDILALKSIILTSSLDLVGIIIFSEDGINAARTYAGTDAISMDLPALAYSASVSSSSSSSISSFSSSVCSSSSDNSSSDPVSALFSSSVSSSIESSFT